MRARLVVLPLVVLLVGVLLSSCSLLQDTTASTSYALTPINTSASFLYATVKIVDDQNALDNVSDITVHFSTSAVKESNYTIFSHQERVICNNITQQLANDPSYLLKVKRDDYNCLYTGYNSQSNRAESANLIAVLKRSMLQPQQPISDGKTYTIFYTPDAADKATDCRITAAASDETGKEVDGKPASDSGVYSSPLDPSLAGSGSIVLTRTCIWELTDTFRRLDITYQSLAKIAVTWSH